MNVDFLIPKNHQHAINAIKEICSKIDYFKIDSIIVNYGIDYSKSLCSKPSDLLHFGIIGAIMHKQIKTKPTSITVETIYNDYIDIYFDQFEGYVIVTKDDIYEYRTLGELENQLLKNN